MSILAYVFAMQFALTAYGVEDLEGFEHDAGRLSVYHPNDGFNAGNLSCGGKLTWKSTHIAYRSWRRMGCGRPVLVCAEKTQRCVWSKVLDAGPFGIYRGSVRRCVPEGRWKVWTRTIRAPKGWKHRAVADLTFALWKKLGKPRALSRIHLYFPPKGWKRGMKKVARGGGAASDAAASAAVAARRLAGRLARR